jgi:hypothetical protein
MKNIHVLPTDKPSRLHFTEFEEELVFTPQYEKLNGVNIYITSDEEIKDVRPYKDKWQLEKGQILNKFPNYLTDLSDCKLVIMTTDQDLIKDGVQEIPEYFLVHYIVGNNPIEYVEIKEHLESIDTMKINYELIIPKEELKQETLEEVVSKQFQEDFNKEVGKVLTQELQKRESETPVEWIYRNLLENPISNQDVEYNEAVFHNAKEMEKEQDKNKYSDEDILDAWELGAKEGLPLTREKKEELFEQLKKK